MELQQVKDILLRSEQNLRKKEEKEIKAHAPLDTKYSHSSEHLELDLSGLVESIGKELTLDIHLALSILGPICCQSSTLLLPADEHSNLSEGRADSNLVTWDIDVLRTTLFQYKIILLYLDHPTIKNTMRVKCSIYHKYQCSVESV